MRMAMPFRTALSLKALMACVTKSGRKFRDFRMANWLCLSVSWPLMKSAGPQMEVVSLESNMSDL